jgi:hypothetical protein
VLDRGAAGGRTIMISLYISVVYGSIISQASYLVADYWKANQIIDHFIASSYLCAFKYLRYFFTAYFKPKYWISLYFVLF